MLPKTFYICTAIILAVVFLAMLYQPIQAMFHEQDLWTMIPIISFFAQEHSFFENLKMFLFDPTPTNEGDPWMNLYLLLVPIVFGLQAKYFIFVALVIHFSCAFLLYALLRKLDLGFRIAFFSALIYLTMFIHFGYYIFPMAAHHFIVLFFSLLILNLYFETTKRIDDNGNWKHLFWLTIGVNFLASFCQITILLLPAAILCHILISSKDGQDRVKKYDIWMPLFITYLGYPLIRLLYSGFLHLSIFLHSGFKAPNNIMPFPIAFMLGISLLFMFRDFLQLYSRYRLGRALKTLCIASIILYTIVFIAVSARGDLMTPSKVKLSESLSPVNLIRPLVVMLVNFISPLKAALSIDSTKPFHIIPTQNNPIGYLVVLFFAVVFMKKYLLKHKSLIVFLIFYIVELRYARIATTVLYSRHFLYITPLFSVMFCSVFIYLYDAIMSRTRLRDNIKEIILILVFAGLCLPNILAIRLEMFRGRMANTFYLYDYIKAADMIKKDIESSNAGRRVEEKSIFVKNVASMPFYRGLEFWSPELDEHLRLDPFRYAFVQALSDGSMVGININPSGRVTGKFTYEIKYAGIYNAAGLNIDKFSSYLDEAEKELISGNNKEAYILLTKAAGIRPFLINYVLSKYELRDLKWITGGSDLKSWTDSILKYELRDLMFITNGNDLKSWTDDVIKDITGYNMAKFKYVSPVITKEINSYIKCLFYKAYLEHLSGSFKESGNTLSQIGFIESDRVKIASLLGNELPVRSNKEMQAFLHNNIDKISMPYNAGPAGFYGFVIQLVFNRDMG